MKMHVIGSSSSGNCYLLQADNGDTLIIELGVNISEIKKALEWRVERVKGCVVTHTHQDHAKSLREAAKCGISILCTADTLANELNKGKDTAALNAFCRVAEPLKGYSFGSFKVFTLPAVHDVPCLAYVITHPEMGKLLFATDTVTLRHRVPGLTHIMIECNYSDRALQEAIDFGDTPAVMRERLLVTHMELQSTIATLRANDLTEVRDVTLLHLSHFNSQPSEMHLAVTGATGKPVYIARPGLTLNYDI